MDHRRGFLVVFAVSILLCISLLTVFLYGELSTGIFSPAPLTVQVQRGESLGAFAHRLGEEGTLRQPGFFRLLAVLRGDAGRIKAGEYVLQGAISPSRLMDYLVAGGGQLQRITIPEGWSLRDIAEKLDREGKGHGQRFLELAGDPVFIATLDLPFALPRPLLEGLAFPETYYVAMGTGEAELIRIMVREFLKQGYPLLRDRAAAVGMTPYEALTLASIIEKETGVEEERPLISAVFHNRLKAKMRLSSDPTVIYGIDGFNGNLTRKDLSEESAYNTYRKGGLPPTPIASPGRASLEAAVAPARADYLYFVAKGDGTHHFSTTYKAHSQAVWQYQQHPHGRKRNS